MERRESTNVSRLSWVAIVAFAVVVLALAIAVGQPARAECEAQGGQLVFHRASGLTCQFPD
jgi:putative hemolysin